MAGLAMIAREAGHEVSGSDAAVYPPMSTQLERAGMRLMEGYAPAHLQPAPEQVVVGNVMRRGMPMVEAMLDRGLDYISGPQWLAEQVLRSRWVLAVAGTHGKTTTASMLAWILEYAGLKPGFLIGGLPADFDCSARLGEGPFFVIEADEYDTAFFDKRSKFVHYRPRTLVLNNLEFDHADIFPDLAAIQTQFHHLIRTVPGEGLIVSNANAPALDSVLERGVWTPVLRFGGGEWCAVEVAVDGSAFQLSQRGRVLGEVNWGLLGQHNVQNALGALAAARHAGVPPQLALEALGRFGGVARRMQLRGTASGVRVFDDFAHHPTAIASTLAGARASGLSGRLIAVLEPRSNTMRMGVHKTTLMPALAESDWAHVLLPTELEADFPPTERVTLHGDVDAIVRQVSADAHSGDTVVVMSNGAFGGIHQRLLDALAARSSVG
jgi:UDP-N-acetylmuramate: L-alanyl-gamma-D-glutamyl-meso-diaminopimelate ligase